MNKSNLLILVFAIILVIILAIAGILFYFNASSEVSNVEEKEVNEKIGEPLESNPGQVRVEILE